MNCFVTGASGFIGANLVHELRARGHRVKALLRPNADRRGLAGAEIEAVPGDLLDDRAKLTAALRGLRLVLSCRRELPPLAPRLRADVCRQRGRHAQHPRSRRGRGLHAHRVHQHRGLHRPAAPRR